MIKECRVCAEQKDISSFGLDKSKKDGHHSICKPCASLWYAKYYLANKDKIKSRAAQWHRDNFEIKSKRMKLWAEKNRTRSNEIKYKWAEMNPEKTVHLQAQRRGAQKQSTPVWANRFYMAEAYALARLRTKVTGVKWHVDHIVPIQSKKVCGLHVENNLQVIPASINSSKKNLYWPDMPNEVTHAKFI